MAEPLKPGIYFGLQSEVYHQDTALSRSNLHNLLDTPNTFWLNSWMNPARKDKKKTDSMIYGSAFDCMLFDPQLFKARFQVVPIDPWDTAKLKIELAEFNSIVDSIKVLRASPDTIRFLTGGMPHVIIVFEWNGQLFRCEHDYFTANQSSDYKAVYSLADYHLKNSFRDYGLDIQMALYKKSRERFKEQYLAGEAKVYGEVTDDFFTRFMKSELNEFMFIFQRDTEPYPFRPIFPEDDTEESGLTKIEEAMKIYNYYLKEYGVEKPWPVCSGKPEVFSMFYGRR